MQTLELLYCQRESSLSFLLLRATKSIPVQIFETGTRYHYKVRGYMWMYFVNPLCFELAIESYELTSPASNLQPKILMDLLRERRCVDILAQKNPPPSPKKTHPNSIPAGAKC